MDYIGIIDIARAVKEKTLVHFVEYRKGELWYKTAYGEMFPVPIEDCGDAAFEADIKAILMMRYMRKWNKRIEEGKIDG